MEYNIYGGFKDMVQILNTNQNQKKKKVMGYSQWRTIKCLQKNLS